MNHDSAQQPPHNSEHRLLMFAVVFSLVGHVLLFGISHMLTKSNFKSTRQPQAIDIDLVQADLTPIKEPKKKRATAQPAQKSPSKSKKMQPKKSAAPLKNRKAQVKTPAKKALSGQAAVKRNRRVVTPEELVQHALQQIKKETKKGPEATDSLADRLKRMRQDVEKNKPLENGVRNDGVNASGKRSAAQVSIEERYQRTIEIIIRKNWAFPVQLAGGENGLESQLIFTVMPDGSVRDTWVSKRSGNANFDRSALSAVQKSNPLPPFPAGLNLRKMPFVILFDINDLI